MIKIVVVAAALAIITGCLPEEPAIPNGAICTPDGFQMEPTVNTGEARINPITGDVEFDIDFVYGESGEALTCDFTY